MSLESIKIDIAKQLFNIDKMTVLEQIKRILEKEAVVAYTTSGEPLTKEAYIAKVKAAEADIEQGNYTTHEQLLKDIEKW